MIGCGAGAGVAGLWAATRMMAGTASKAGGMINGIMCVLIRLGVACSTPVIASRRRSNPAFGAAALDCFAALAMTALDVLAGPA